MAELKKRLGKGFWIVQHKEKLLKRKVQRTVKGTRIVRTVIINGKKVRV